MFCTCLYKEKNILKIEITLKSVNNQWSVELCIYIYGYVEEMIINN